MRSTLKHLVKLTAGYSPVTLIGPLSLIFLTPLYTRVLTPADYGVVDVVLTMVTLITTVVNLGLDQALNAFFYDGDLNYQKKLVTSVSRYLFGIGLVTASLILMFAEPIGMALFADAGRRTIIILLAINVMVVPIYGISSATLRLQTRVRDVNTLAIVNIVLLVGSNIVLVLLLHFKATGTVLANTIASTACAVLGLFFIRSMLKEKFDIFIFKPAFMAGIWLVGGTIGNAVLVSGDRLLMTQYVSPSSLGLYSIANKLAMMVSVLFTGAWMGWMPLSMSIAQKDGAAHQFARIYELFLCATLIGALGLGLFSSEILSIFATSSFVPAAPYAAVLMFYTGPITTTANTFAIGLFAQKKTVWIGISVVAGAAANIALNLWLLPKLGIWGAVASTIIAGCLWVTVAYWASQHAFFVPYRWKPLGVMVGIYAAIIGTFLMRPDLFPWPVKLSTIALTCVAIPIVGIVSWSQLATIWHSAQHRIRSRFSSVP